MTMKPLPVIEVFGPVIQGEGPVAGQVTHFIRFGLCDYRCEWCDSLYAVLPKLVKENATFLTEEEIVEKVGDLGPSPWVTLSGGNPAIHDLGKLVRLLQWKSGVKVCVETQGSKWRPWLEEVDLLVVSPKPPSSKMVSEKNRLETEGFMLAASGIPNEKRALKIVVFDTEDLLWAEQFFLEHINWTQRFLSVGTPVPEPGESLETTRELICDQYRSLCLQVPDLAVAVTVLPQLHVLAWGHERGV